MTACPLAICECLLLPCNASLPSTPSLTSLMLDIFNVKDMLLVSVASDSNQFQKKWSNQLVTITHLSEIKLFNTRYRFWIPGFDTVIHSFLLQEATLWWWQEVVEEILRKVVNMLKYFAGFLPAKWPRNVANLIYCYLLCVKFWGTRI